MSRIHLLRGSDTPYRPLWIAKGHVFIFKSLMCELGWTEPALIRLERFKAPNSFYYHAKIGSPIWNFQETAKSMIDQGWYDRIHASSLRVWFPSTTGSQSAEILAEWARENGVGEGVVISEGDNGYIKIIIPKLLGFTIEIAG